ncbi:hypothetical protein PVK06_027845 [Gossypium arboreum]|uniref:Uncharacterized protein n=1 Tax=Gossypium arboreum TaxID=29729 RepID=A0ABR0P1G0_GOSAR|nr:hypothetical protein PVK06_027845 [Gossypium arboreum]
MNFLELQGKNFIQECGVDPSFNLNDGIWDLVQANLWTDFCLTPKDLMIVSVVYKFYASLKGRENNMVPDVEYQNVTIQGKEVPITHRDICTFYNPSYYVSIAIDELDIYYLEMPTEHQCPIIF